MSDYQMNISGSLNNRDIKNAGKYLTMVNYEDSLLITLEDYNERDPKIIFELCSFNHIAIDKEECGINGKYIIRGIKEKHCCD